LACIFNTPEESKPTAAADVVAVMQNSLLVIADIAIPHFDDGEPQGLKRVRENSSFAPLGLHHLSTYTHGLRRGLYSYAASRLKSDDSGPLSVRETSSHAVSKASTVLKNLTARPKLRPFKATA
jgi:hypothetical protein